MTDYSPFKGRHRQPDAPLVLSRALWTMRGPKGSEITAAIYEVLTGRQLRVMRGEELLESRLSRAGDAPLEHRASEIRRVMDGKGWQRTDSNARQAI
jgi:hypothetical protein